MSRAESRGPLPPGIMSGGMAIICMTGSADLSTATGQGGPFELARGGGARWRGTVHRYAIRSIPGMCDLGTSPGNT
jgi:hypothetical protein